MWRRVRKRGLQRDDHDQRKATDTDDGTIKDPAEWTTGDEPMTGAQDSYLHTLARKAGEEVGDDLTKAEASIKIDELREKTGIANATSRTVRRRSRRTTTGETLTSRRGRLVSPDVGHLSSFRASGVRMNFRRTAA